MKKLVYTLLFVPTSITASGQQTKYISYFIGDGMGVDQANGIEIHQAELQNGHVGTEPLLFTQLPVTTMATTFSATNSAADPAAAGTALATGKKAYDGAISVGEGRSPIGAVAEEAKKAGKKVGVTTSVSVDHATPTAFYVHRAGHNMGYEIVVGLAKADFGFYAGGGFLKSDKMYDKKDAPNTFPIFEEVGYTVACGYSDYKAKSKDAGKMVLIQEEGKDPSCLPYVIDRKSSDLTFAQIIRSAANLLTKGKNKGFFLMIEGEEIDWAYHDNDAATVFNEVRGMDDAIKVACEFYKEHPKRTLIVVTTDHETGGIVLGTDKYTLNLKALRYQKHPANELSRCINELGRSEGNRVTWEDTKGFLGEEMGFWKQFPISWEQERKLRDEFEQSSVKNKMVFVENMYSKNESIAAYAKEVMGQIPMVGWASGGHSASYVPVFAIGVGSQLFGEEINNTEALERTARTVGYK